jgi:hypothetical protein
MYPEASSKVCHGSFCQLGSSVSLSWVIYYGAFISAVIQPSDRHFAEIVASVLPL